MLPERAETLRVLVERSREGASTMFSDSERSAKMLKEGWESGTVMVAWTVMQV